MVYLRFMRAALFPRPFKKYKIYVLLKNMFLTSHIIKPLYIYIIVIIIKANFMIVNYTVKIVQAYLLLLSMKINS